MPALLLAAKLHRRAEHGGITAPFAADEALVAATEAVADPGMTSRRSGKVLLALVAVGEARGWEAEAAARDAARGYRERLLAAEDAQVLPAEDR